jgi:hypothetical protein
MVPRRARDRQKGPGCARLVRGCEWFTAIVFVVIGVLILLRTGDLPFLR